MDYAFGYTGERYPSSAPYYHDGPTHAVYQQSSVHQLAPPPPLQPMSPEFQKPVEVSSARYTTYTQSQSSNGTPIITSGGRWGVQPPLKHDTAISESSPLPSHPLRPAEYAHYRSTSSWSIQSNNDSYPASYTRSDSSFPQSSVAAPGRAEYEPAEYSAQSPSVDAEQDSENDFHPSGRRRKGLWALVDAPNNNTGNPGYSIKVRREGTVL